MYYAIDRNDHVRALANHGHIQVKASGMPLVLSLEIVDRDVSSFQSHARPCYTSDEQYLHAIQILIKRWALIVVAPKLAVDTGKSIFVVDVN